MLTELLDFLLLELGGWPLGAFCSICGHIEVEGVVEAHLQLTRREGLRAETCCTGKNALVM